MFLVIFLYALLASTFGIGKMLMLYIKPVLLIAIRMILSGLVLLGYQYFFGRAHFKLKRAHYGLFFQLAFLGIYISYVTEFWALYHITSAKLSFFYTLMPFFSALFSYFYFSERMTIKKWLGLSIGFIGFMPILLTECPAEKEVFRVLFFSLYELAALVGVGTFAYSFILIRRLIKQNYTPSMINGVTMLAGGAMALVHALLFTQDITIGALGPFLGWLTLIILIGNVICYNLSAWLLKMYTATFLSLAAFLAPLFASFYGWLFLGEIITWHFYVSAILLFIGLYLFYQEELRQGYIVK